MINARAESITEKPAFKKSFQDQRCLIPADGFYEWKKVINKKIPIFIKSKKIMSFAGIFDVWKSENKEIKSCTIITTEPNELIKPIHNRMPVIIPKEKRETWLKSSNDIVELLKPSKDDLEAFQVSPLVNSPKNNDERCIQPI